MDSASPRDWVLGCKPTTAMVWAFLINTKSCLLRAKKLGHERLLQTKYDLLSPLAPLAHSCFQVKKGKDLSRSVQLSDHFRYWLLHTKIILISYGIGDILLRRTSNLSATDFQRQKVVCQKVHTALLFKVCLEFSNAIVSKDLRV